VGVISISSFTFSDTARAPAVSPTNGTDVESDLWFGPLIEYRERDSIILFAEVASYLRAELSTDNDRLRCARKLLDVPRTIVRAPLPILEEELIWGAVNLTLVTKLRRA